MLIFYAHFPIPSFSDTSSSPRSRCFRVFLFFIITLNLTTITLRPVKRENQLNSHFLLHRLPFYVSFFSFVVYSSSRWLVCWIASLSFSMCVLLYCSLCFPSFGLSHSHHSFRFINLQPFAAFDEIQRARRRK
jgi:hypothetical protein